MKVTGGAVVTAQSKESATAKTFGVTVGAGIGIGASVSEARIAPDMDAFIGTGADVTAGTITIQSLHNFDAGGTEINRGASAQADASGGGLLSGNGTDARAFSTANVETYVGAGAALHATGQVQVIARAHNLAVADANALSIGAAAVGTSLSSATSSGITKAYLQDRDASNRIASVSGAGLTILAHGVSVSRMPRPTPRAAGSWAAWAPMSTRSWLPA